MKSNKYLLLFLMFMGLSTSCKDELDVKNPNQPTPESAATPTGITKLAQGGVYYNGFVLDTYYDGVTGTFFAGPVGFHELMGDVVGAEAANEYLNQIGCPNAVVLDNGTNVPNPQNPNTQYALLRGVNSNAQQGQNPTYHEWAYMYSLNNACNNVLALVDKVTYTSGNADVQKNTIKAWCYWWKGFAYSRLGSIYYAGVISNDPNATNGVYLSKEKLIAEANANFDKAANLLKGLSAGGDYDATVKALIPDFCRVGKGGIIPPDAWIRSINTFKARNILVNNTVATMTAAQWSSILDLTNNGIKSTDLIFTGRSNANADIWSGTSGSVAAKATGDPGGATYKISERLIQDFKTGDKRLDNNFVKGTPWIGNSDRGQSFNTRYALKSGGTGIAGVAVYSNTVAGAQELYIAGSYDENELMKAEAKIYSADIEGGLTIIDAIRTAQGAGLAAVKGTSLALAAAKEELRLERRCGLAFRGLSFYDARRWGVIDPTGGRTNCVVLDKAGAVNTKAKIIYGFLDYWDVPDNELAYNPAAAGSDPIVNPKK